MKRERERENVKFSVYFSFLSVHSIHDIEVRSVLRCGTTNTTTNNNNNNHLGLCLSSSILLLCDCHLKRRTRTLHWLQHNVDHCQKKEFIKENCVFHSLSQSVQSIQVQVCLQMMMMIGSRWIYHEQKNKEKWYLAYSLGSINQHEKRKHQVIAIYLLVSCIIQASQWKIL